MGQDSSDFNDPFGAPREPSKGEPAAPSADPLPPLEPLPPVEPALAAPEKPPAEPASPSSADAGIRDFLMRRVEQLERSLREERERSARKETSRSEVEEQLRAVSELMRRERDASHARGRIEALEARLDKMHETWSQGLDRLAAGRDEQAVKAVQAAQETLAHDVAAVRAGLGEIVESLKRQAAMAALDADADRKVLGQELKGLKADVAALAESLQRRQSLEASDAGQRAVAQELKALKAEVALLGEAIGRRPDLRTVQAVESAQAALAAELKRAREFFQGGVESMLETGHQRLLQAWSAALGRVSAAQTAAAVEASQGVSNLRADLSSLSEAVARLPVVWEQSARASAELRDALGRDIAHMGDRLAETEARLSRDRDPAALQAALRKMAESWASALDRLQAVQESLERDRARLRDQTTGLVEALAAQSATRTKELSGLSAGIRSLVGNFAQALRQAEEDRKRAQAILLSAGEQIGPMARELAAKIVEASQPKPPEPGAPTAPSGTDLFEGARELARRLDELSRLDQETSGAGPASQPGP